MFVSQDNNNKFYKMNESGDGTFTVLWGRVGTGGQSTKYPISQWDAKLNEKLKKGYTRVAGHSSSLAPTVTARDVKIDDDEVRELVLFLIKSAKQSIAKNYLVSAGEVTQAQVDEAQAVIGELKIEIQKTPLSCGAINTLLEKLYRTIPRKMANTKDFFLTAQIRGNETVEGNAMRLLQAEQSLLDTLQSQVGSSAQQADAIDLESLGLEIDVASKADRDRIAKETDFMVGNQRIFRVVNKSTETSFNKGTKHKLLYHGSKNENWMSVLQKGLLIRPSGVSTTGSMFGDGIYFANKARKSIGYTSLRGSYWASGSANKAYLAIFEVNVGKMWGVLDKQTYQSWMGRLDQKQVTAKGCDTVFAKGGVDLKNDEHIVYEGGRCTIRYLIELTA